MSQIPFRVRRSSLMMLGMAVLLLSGCSGDGGETGGAPGAACQSNCPTAKAGPEQAVVTGAAVTLDGSGSTSGTPGLITYQWALTSKPTGSAATLAGATTARPTFTADVAGTYDARLVVQEGGASSAPDSVRITCGTGNLAPIADAGADRTEPVGSLVTLDGTGSRDPNGTPITYAWRVVTQPAGSQAVLLNATGATPLFTPHVAGPYTFALTVKDGTLTSPPDEVTITVTTANCPPIANAGADQQVTTGRLVTLSGAGSTDPNDNPLTYSWRFQSKPDGSAATVAAANSVSPTFTPDRAGFYVLSLIVNDGTVTSAPDTVVIEATLPGFVNLALQAYLKPSNPVAGTPNIPEFFPGNQFGFSMAISGDTLAVGGPTDRSCASGINGDQANPGCGGGTGAVYVFTRTASGWSQQAYVKASNPSGGLVDTKFNPAFGASVALSGDTLAVGAPRESSCGVGVNGDQTQSGELGCRLSGAVYVFTRTNGSWAQQAYVKASSNIGPFSAFGESLALHGDTLAVNSKEGNGEVVEVFTRAAGVWAKTTTITPKVPNVQFVVSSLALTGDTLAVGNVLNASCARGINGDETNTGCPGAGAAYVFTQTNGTWTQQAYIKASNTANTSQNPVGGDFFGSSVALAGDSLAVGANNESSCGRGINGDQTHTDPACLGAGAVYVFTRTNGTWAQQAYVKPSNTGQNFASLFGQSVALLGDTLAVGYAGETSCATGINGNQANTDCPRSGAVYVYKRAAGVWSQAFYVKASNTDLNDRFGVSVALSNEVLVAGAPLESSCAAGVNGNQADNNCFAVGAAYIYVSK
jgi:hypothetical protein